MEIWKDIKGYEGLYQVSNLGNVKNLITGNLRRFGSVRGVYKTVRLSKESKVRTVLVHRLVADAFIPNPHTKPQVNHKNCIKDDNCCDNLEWVTAKENTRHAIDNGVFVFNKKNCVRKISDKDMPKIKKMLNRGYGLSEVGRKFNVCPSTIYRIKKILFLK